MTRKIIKSSKSEPISSVVKIACKGATTLSLFNMKEFQGDLKELLEEDFERLKKEIIEQGFSFSFQIWQHEGINYICDGHQRYRVLIRMSEEGWEIPEVPCSLVYADDYQSAKRKCLGAASNYGRVTNDGLLNYIQDMNISPENLVQSYRFGDLNIEKFVASNFDSISTTEVSAHDRKLPDGSKELSEEEFEKFDHKCPRCAFEFNG